MMTVWHVPEDGIGKNPYGQLLTRSLEARDVRVVPIPYGHLFGLRAFSDRPDIVHFQFIAPFVLPAGPSRSWSRALVKGPVFLAQVALLRLAGCRIAWTVHNLVNHERRLAGVEWFFSFLFTRLAHLLIVHGEVARSAVIGAYHLGRRADKVVVVPHPNFIDAYPDRVTRAQARGQLGVDADTVMIACLGMIRAYKGLLELVRAFRPLPDDGRAELWIAGEPVDAALAAELRREANGSPRIHLRLEFLSADEVEVLLKACDVVAMPYRSILTSGAALLAMSFAKPCVAPRLGCLSEVLDESGAFLYDPTDLDGLGGALARAIESSASLPSMGQHNRTRAAAWSWAAAADLLLERYGRLFPAGLRLDGAERS
jgi:beta-1,4-mannosyltransferase